MHEVALLQGADPSWYVQPRALPWACLCDPVGICLAPMFFILLLLSQVPFRAQNHAVRITMKMMILMEE